MPSQDTTTPGGPTSATDKTLIVLQAAIQSERFSEIVAQTGFAKATVHRILKSLQDYKFVTLSEDGRYLPGPTSLKLAGAAFDQLDISTLAAPFLEELKTLTKCTVHLGALSGDDAIYLAKRNGPTPYQLPSGIGQRLRLHCTAIGKAILAGMSEGEINSLVATSGLTPRTPNSLTTLANLHADLEEVRRRGYSFDDEENVPGIRCIGAPIFNHSGHVTHGISVTSLSMERTRTEMEEFAPAITSTAQKISQAIGARRFHY